MSAQQFTLGSKVRLKAEPTEVGVVTAANAYSGGWTYTVFFKGLGDQQVTEGALEQVLQPREIQVVSRKAFLRTLLLTKLDNPLNDHFYSFQASRTEFEAYQFKPVLKFLDSPVPAILIADEVGLGKTIEAAILHQELKARGEIRRVLVICPAGLRQKWQAELLNRFDESFKLMYAREVIEDARFFRDTDGHAPLQGIVSLETYRNADVQAVLDEIKVTYDLVIIDEAHHLRSSGTLSNQVGERAQEMSDHLVLLTATPLQTSQQDLFNLLRFLDPAQFSDFDDFLLQLAPNALLNEAIRHLREDPPDLLSARMALGRITSLAAAGQVTSHPTYPLVMKALDTGRLEREELVRLRRDIDSLNMLSAIYTRTKKGDVSRVARRKAFALKVQATDQEQEFLAAVLAHARAQARARSGSGWAPAFAGIMRERQAASCITAMREYLEEGMKLKAGSGSAPVLGVEQSATELDALDPTGGDERPGDVAQQLAVAARALGKQDSKFDLFSRTLTDLLRESPDSKVLVFTFFRRTLSYLVRRLKSQGIPVVEIHGGVPPDERAIRIANFREGQDVRVLVTTEVGSEGLDFQFCDTIFNYDLPWNPMRVEQRIGRIDRYGQQKDQVRIYSMYMAGTIEERILERLYERIGIFEESVGDLEPILGPITAELTKEVFTSELTPDDELRLAEKFAQMVIARREAERELEQKSSKLMGQDAMLLQAVNDNVHAGRYVSPAELRAIVDCYLEEVTGSGLIDRAGDGSVMVSPSAPLQSKVSDQMGRAKDHRPAATRFLQRLSDGRQIPGTFSGEHAQRMPLLEFFNIRHPLVQVAVEHYRSSRHAALPPMTGIRVDSSRYANTEGPWPDDGTYRFALFLLTVRGAVQELRLVPVAFDLEGRRVTPVEDRLLRLIQEFGEDSGVSSIVSVEREHLERRAMAVMSSLSDQVHAETLERNEASIAVRRATLERTFGHRIRKREAILAGAQDSRIIRMRKAELSNLRADLARRLADLDSKRAVAVTFAMIGCGTLEVGRRVMPVEAPPEPPSTPGWPIADPNDDLTYGEPPTMFRP